MSSDGDGDAQQLAQLVRLFRAREGDSGDARTKSVSSAISSSTSSDDAKTEGFAIVASIGVERMKVLLADRLAAQVAIGQSQYQDHEFLDAFQAVFWALHAPSNAHEGEQWRKKLFAMVIQSMHAQNASNALAAAILNVLMRELHHLNVVDLPVVIEELVRGVLLCQQLQRLRPAEGLVIYYSIELLPQLLLRVAQCPLLEFDDSVMADQCSGAEYKNKVVTKFFALAWPKRFFLQVLKTFRDFHFNDEQERELCGKIFREANGEIPDEIALDASGARRNDCFESLPTIFYNVMLLIGRTKNEFCKRLLMNMLLRKCDAIASGSALLYTDQRSGAGSSTSSGRFTGTANGGREIKVLLSTMVYHVDLVLKHDESISKVFMAEYELRMKDLTSFDIGLLLTIATQDKYEARVNSFLIQRVTQSYKTEALEYGIASEANGVATRSAFLDTIVHPQDGSWSPVTQRMVHFGFLLLAHGASKQDESNASLQSKQQQLQSHPGDRMELPWVDFAIRIILGCFQHHVSAREKIVDQLVNSIIVQDGGSKTAIKLLARIVKRHPLEINHKLVERLQECLEYVTHMTPQNARLLFSALSPLLKVRPNLKSFIILTLRKAMFRKDEESRMIAIIGFAFLLCLSSTIFSRSSTLTQLYSQNTSILLSQGVQNGGSIDSEIATQEHANAVVAEDLYRQFCGIFKRAFQLQTRVRLVLYAELDKVFHECPTLRPSILELAFQHYSKYYDENESILPPLKIDSCLARKRGFYEEPLGYLLHVLLICVLEIKKDSVGENDMDDMLGDDDIPATQTASAQNSFEAIERNVSILMERMKRCELADFEIDKNLSFAPQTAMGQSNQRLAKILLDVWEVCINWTIGSSSGGMTLDEATWGTLVHYLEMHKWLKARLKESEDKEKGADGGDRKRGRLSNKQKLQQQSATATVGTTAIAEQGSSQQSAKNEDFAAFFGEHASFNSGLLLSPSSILSLLEFSKKKLQDDLSGTTRDDEHLLLFMLDKAALLVEFAQQSVTTSAGNMFNQKSVLVGESRVLVDRLGSIVFGIFFVCHESGGALNNASSSSSLASNKSQASQLEDIRFESLKVFAAIVGVWMMKSSEEAADYLAYALSSVGIQDEDELMGDGDTSKLENCAVVLHKLLDAMILKNMAREAIVVLGVIRSVWCKLPSRVITKYESWMKHALLRSNFASQKLLETMVKLFLRPHPEIGLLASFTLQLTKGLLHYCNGGDDDGEVTEFANAPDRLRLGRFDDKCIVTCATAVLARCEEATSELEPTVKDFDAQQRRQTMKLKEDDVALLQLLEDETGASVLDIANTTSKSHAKFKGICRKVFELCGILLPFVMMELSKVAVSIRVIRLIGRLYKLLVVMVNCKLRRKDSTLPKYLQRLFDRVAVDLTPTLLQFIACIHDEGKKVALAGVSKGKRAKQTSSSTATTNAQSKLIPDMIFQMEQFDVALIKLSKLSKVRLWLKLALLLGYETLFLMLTILLMLVGSDLRPVDPTAPGARLPVQPRAHQGTHRRGRRREAASSWRW